MALTLSGNSIELLGQLETLRLSAVKGQVLGEVQNNYSLSCPSSVYCSKGIKGDVQWPKTDTFHSFMFIPPWERLAKKPSVDPDSKQLYRAPRR